MFNRETKSKQKILDLARDLPRQIEKLEKEITVTVKSINSLPEPLERINMLVENKINKTNNEIYFLEIGTTLNELDVILTKLIKLASEKEELKESARLRKAKVKTGNVKAEIDSQLPDEKLLKMTMDFSSAYKKFCDYAKYTIFGEVLNPTRIFPVPDELIDRFISIKEFIKNDQEVRGKHLNDMFFPILKERDEIKKNLSSVVKLYNYLLNLDDVVEEREQSKRFQQY